MGMIEKAYSEMPGDLRYQQMLNIYRNSPRYIETLTGIYKDNVYMLTNLAAFRQSGPGGVLASADIYQQILKINPNNVDALNMLGAMALGAGKEKEAENYLNRAIELVPEFTAARFNLGLLYEKTGRYKDAWKQWEQCASNPNDERSADQWGMCLASQGKFDEAAKYFCRAVELKPTFLTARMHLAIALHKLGRTPEALPHIRYILKIDPQNKFVLQILAEMEGQKKNPQPASPVEQVSAASQ